MLCFLKVFVIIMLLFPQCLRVIAQLAFILPVNCCFTTVVKVIKQEVDQ